MEWPEYFDSKFPTVAEIGRRYSRKLIDLTTYEGLTHENVADAVIQASLKGIGMVIPEGPGVYQFWDRDKVVSVKGKKIKMKSALRFMKFGPSIDLTKRRTTASRLRQEKLTPRKLFKEVLDSPDNREKMLEGSYRGIGWWDPKSKTHRLLPFDVMAEGEKFRDFYGKEMEFSYQQADAYVTVPSLGKEDVDDYVIALKVLPITSENDTYLHEWPMTNSPCGCKDRFFRGAAGQVRADREIQNIYKYAIPEEPYCRHGWGTLIQTQERGDRRKDAASFLVKFPAVKGLMGPWYVLSTATIIKPVKGSARRPLKTEVRIQLGREIGHMGTDYMFDLTE
jgi:hypothetical protein